MWFIQGKRHRYDSEEEDKIGNTKMERSFIDDGCPTTVHRSSASMLLATVTMKLRKHVASDCHDEAPQACC